MSACALEQGNGGHYCQSISMAEHMGSHVDAPSHKHPHLMHQTVDRMPVTALIGRAVVYHFGDLGLAAGDMVTRGDILAYESHEGVAVGGDEIALLDFDWMRYWSTGRDAHWYASNQPGLSEEAVRLFQERGVKAVGADTLACETALKDGVELAAYGHNKHWLPNGIYIVEELANLGSLPNEVFFMALPLNIVQGSGSPVRAIAFLP